MSLQEVLRRAQRPFITIHLEPDGDAVGSALALARALEGRGKRVTLSSQLSIPSSLSFLPGSEGFGPHEPRDEDLAIALDGSDLSRFGSLGERIGEKGLPLLNIDHHVTNQQFGTFNLVRPEAAATAEIIFDLLADLAIPLDPLVATCLLTGIVTDTQGFRTPNTTIRALEIAAQLMRAGASLNQITENVFGRDLATLRLWGGIMEGLRKDGRVVWAVETEAMRRRYGVSSGRGNGVVNLLASAKEAEITILFQEREDGLVEVRLRSKPGVDVASIARHFGGGGHPQAAGCSLRGSLAEVRRKVLDRAKGEDGSGFVPH